MMETLDTASARCFFPLRSTPLYFYMALSIFPIDLKQSPKNNEAGLDCAYPIH